MSDRSTLTPEENLGDLPKLALEQVAELEAQNGLLQFDLMNEMVSSALKAGRLRLTPEHVCQLQARAVQGLEKSPGTYRSVPVTIGGTSHVPPPADQIPALILEMCAYVNREPTAAQARHLAAYAMWRLNWIHPFTNGNGRTSRAVSYLVLSALVGLHLPGKTTVPELIAADRQPYYGALDAADAAWKQGRIDVSKMELLLADLLRKQLLGSRKA